MIKAKAKTPKTKAKARKLVVYQATAVFRFASTTADKQWLNGIVRAQLEKWGAYNVLTYVVKAK